MKELRLHQVWTISPDQLKVKAMLIYRAGFTSFPDLCLRLHQVMDKPMHLT